MGLVLGKVFANPLACGADSFGGSTHKTFPGPQKAVFVTDREDLAERVRQTQDFMLSSHHFAATISLGIALLEFRDFGGERYARSVVENTRSFARALDRCGVDVAAADRGYSAGHQLWLDVEAGGVGARVASDRLYEAGLRVNFLDDLPGFSRPALRIGLNEATFRGVGDEDLDVLAEVFAAALHARAPAAQLAASVAEVLSRSHRRYGIPVVPGEPLLDQALALCAQALAGTPVADDVCRRV
jgi:glycine/serine hydroxymethyltransferase